MSDISVTEVRRLSEHVGDEVRLSNIALEVTAVQRRRIERLRLRVVEEEVSKELSE